MYRNGKKILLFSAEQLLKDYYQEKANHYGDFLKRKRKEEIYQPAFGGKEEKICSADRA